MALADEIRALRDRSLAALDAAHDYHVETQFAWQVVRNSIRGGRSFTILNKATGTSTTQTDLVAKSRAYVATRLPEATFQQFLSIFEAFVFDFLRLWLTAYPMGLFRRMVDFESIWNAADKEAITRMVVDKELNEILYERPAGWFSYLEGRVKLGCPTADDVARIAEAKATRDALVHNQGVANRTYEAKAGAIARHREGERIDIPDDYHRATWLLLRRVVADISDAAVAKVM
jgi:hypothetical protein